MKPHSKTIATIGILAAVTATGSISLQQWFAHRPSVKLELRIPGMGGPESRRGTSAEVIDNPEGTFVRFDGQPSDLPGYWPWFRGADRQNINTEAVKLLDAWPEDGPPILWQVTLGEGHAGPTVTNGCVYVIDYDEKKLGDSLRCFSLADGKEIWRRWYKLKVKRNHGISRTVPALIDGRVITMGPKGHVMCVEASTGDFHWSLDLGNKYNAEIPTWYTAQCPLVDDGKVILAPAGDKLMIAVDVKSGEILWETPNPREWKMSHSSIMPMNFHGQTMYVYNALGGMVGVSADDGRILWDTEEWKSSVVAPSPMQLPGDRLFVTAGYRAGSMMFNVKKDGEVFTLETIATLTKKEFAAEQQTPIYHLDHLFSVMPNDAGSLKKQLVCYHPDNGLVWASGNENRFGLGPFLMGDGKIFVLRDDGLLTMARAGIEAYEELAKYQVLPEGHDAWGPMALVDGRLLLRDSTRLICVDLADR